jgi:hypothetical protein
VSPKWTQLASHANLCRDLSRSPAPPAGPRRAQVDAVIVPASRPASFLQPIIELAACLGTFLVVLCSAETRAEQVSDRVARTPGARSLIITIFDGWKHCCFPTRTSDSAFRLAKGDRANDLSLKRNLGLLLARLRGWNKVVFIDDDITLSETNIRRLAWHLDEEQVAGMVVRQHPDNSVVCHARRLAGLYQDVFVTGAALGVHCNSLPLSFFPDIYNEDWFFFAKEAIARKLPYVGEAMQVKYNPYASPYRARREEFGDLLAEGLYALIGENERSLSFGEVFRGSTRSYWSQFIDARYEVIAEVETALRHDLDEEVEESLRPSALAALNAAKSQLDTITPDICLNFLDAWQDDLDDWQKFSTGLNSVGGTREAMDFLQLKRWILTDFGAAAVDWETAHAGSCTIVAGARSATF